MHISSHNTHRFLRLAQLGFYQIHKIAHHAYIAGMPLPMCAQGNDSKLGEIKVGRGGVHFAESEYLFKHRQGELRD